MSIVLLVDCFNNSSPWLPLMAMTNNNIESMYYYYKIFLFLKIVPCKGKQYNFELA